MENKGAPHWGFSPDPRNVYLVVDVTLQNVLTTSLSYSQLNLRLKDGENREYSTTLACSILTGNLPAGGDLRPGETVRGFICFEVSNSQTRFILKHDEIFGDILIDIDIS